VLSGLFSASLIIDAIQPGMLGSPVLNEAGHAVGVASVGSDEMGYSDWEPIKPRCGPQPILTLDLPRWVLATGVKV
jgi:hypothetical protein